MTAITLIQHKRRIGLTDNQLLVLLTVADGLCCMTDICERVGLAPSAVSRVAQDLKTLGMLADNRPERKGGNCTPAFFWLTPIGTENLRKLLTR